MRGVGSAPGAESSLRRREMAEPCKKCDWAARKHGYYYKATPKPKTLQEALYYQVHTHQVKGKLVMFAT